MGRRRLLWPLAAALIVVAGVLMAASSDWYVRRDFSSLYQGARLVWRIDVYDDVAWCREARGAIFGAVDPSGAQLCPAVFLYPLWTAVLLLPLGLLPIEVAASLWCALSIAAVLAGLRWSWLASSGAPRAFPLLLAAVIGGEPFWLMLAGGQLGGVLLAGLALGVLLLARGRERAAGVALGVLALKPHVLGLAILALVARSIRRAPGVVIGSIGAVAGLLAISLPFLITWPVEWIRESFFRQTGYSPSLATAWGIAAHDLGNVLWAIPLIAALCAVVVAIARDVHHDAVAFMAQVVPLALFAAPYAWSYDFVVLALPIAFIFARLDPLGGWRHRALRIATVLVAAPLSWLLYVLAFARGVETLSAAVPAIVAILVALTTAAPRARSA